MLASQFAKRDERPLSSGRVSRVVIARFLATQAAEDANPCAIGSSLLVRETPDIGQVIISLRFLDLPIGV
jgi:hypothetical protein